MDNDVLTQKRQCWFKGSQWGHCLTLWAIFDYGNILHYCFCTNCLQPWDSQYSF